MNRTKWTKQFQTEHKCVWFAKRNVRFSDIFCIFIIIFQSFVSSTLSDLLDIHILGDLSSLERLPGLEENEADIFSPGKPLRKVVWFSTKKQKVR